MNRFITLPLTLSRLALSLVGIGLVSACTVAPRLAEEGARVREQTSAVNRGTRQEPMAVNGTVVGSPEFADARAEAARHAPVARHASRAWIGARMTAVQSDSVLPPIFSEQFKLNFDDSSNDGRVSIAVIAERLSRITKVPVRVKQDVYNRAGGANPDSQQAGFALPAMSSGPVPGAPLPTGLPGAGANMVAGGPLPTVNSLGARSLRAGGPLPMAFAARQQGFQQPITDVQSVDMRWDGSLSSFLDHVTGRLNLSWSYRDNVVVIERYITENFELAAFVGQQDFKMSLGGNSTGKAGTEGATGQTTASMDVNESGKIAALESLRKSIDAMVRPNGGQVVMSEGSGRFTVTATKDVMSRVREVLKFEDAAMMRQAHIQFDIYSVTLNDIDEKGVDWNIVYQNLSRTWGAVLASPASLTGNLAGGLGYSILRPADGLPPSSNTQARFGSSSAVLNLLNQISDTAQYRPVSMIALNRQWARKTNLTTTGYLSETTPATASSVGSGAPGLKTSSVVTGDKILVQPAIMDNGVILLKFGVSLTELLGLFDVTTGTGLTLQKVQTPNTSGTDDQGTVRLMPGEAMIITGLSRRLSSGDTRTLADGLPIAAGGSRKLGYKREDFLIVVRAVQI